jgi:hypothetical protein
MAAVKMLSFKDIQTENVLYFDTDWKDDCYTFCLDHNIDQLPSIEDPTKIYIRDEQIQTFRVETIKPERMVDQNFNIFSQGMLERFRLRPLLLVYSHSELSGVVHFSDYNKPVVSIFLYELFFSYEKALRAILVLRGFGNKDMLEFLTYKSSTSRGKKSKKYFADKISKIKIRLAKNEKLPAMQTFDFKDLMEFCVYKEIATISFSVNKLRNMIMHAHELVNIEDPSTDEYIYNFDSFEEFFNLVVELLHDYKKVVNLLAFMSQDPSLHNG